MRNASPPVLREFETWLSLLTDGDLPDRHKWKAWFCVAEYESEDFDALVDLLAACDGTASFAFLGRDADDQAPIIEALDTAGHEIAFHSHRHHGYADLNYDTAHEAITTGLASIEDATGIRPRGFFAPFLDLSDGSVRAIQEVGFDWVLGRSQRDIDEVAMVEPVIPFDTTLFEEASPAEAMERLRIEASAGHGPFLFHPPVIEFYNGMAAFEGWLTDVEPVSVGEQIRTAGTGMILDCIRPVRVE